MPVKFEVRYSGFEQISQQAGGDEHMSARLFFDLFVDGIQKGQYHTDIKQTVGSAFSDEGFEIGRPEGYKGPFDQGAFRKTAEDYYRRCIGPKGWAISFGPGAGILMANNFIASPMSYSFESNIGAEGW